MLKAQKAMGMDKMHDFDVLATVPNLMPKPSPFQPPKDIFARPGQNPQLDAFDAAQIQQYLMQVGRDHPEIPKPAGLSLPEDPFFTSALNQYRFSKDGSFEPAIRKPAGLSLPEAEDPYAGVYHPNLLQGMPFSAPDAHARIRLSNLSKDSPAFIDIASSGYPAGPVKPADPAAQPRDLLGEFYYAML
jgi:hypothetical protein